MANTKMKCAFCGRSEDDAFLLTSPLGRGVAICEECVKVAYDCVKEALGEAEEKAAAKVTKKAEEANIAEEMTPTEIRRFLDQYVIGQDYAKRILSVAVYNHMKMLNHYDSIKDGDVELEKSNVLMVGPSGCGKTHIIKNLARLFKVPYAIADATTLTESGYVGSDVETVLQKLLFSANGDVKKAERGIVFIDEIDKITSKSQNSGEVSREGVQRDILPIVEGSQVNTKYGVIHTDHVLFIASGAFHLSKPSDLIPELQGRFPIRVELDDLTSEDFVKILKEPNNALVKQYIALLGTEGIKVTFTLESLERIAEIAFQVNRDTDNIGARRLHTILEKLLEDLLFEASDAQLAEITITEAYVDEKLAEISQNEDLSRYIL